MFPDNITFYNIICSFEIKTIINEKAFVLIRTKAFLLLSKLKYFIPEYYTAIPDSSWFAKKGIFEKEEGFHDTYDITATIMTVDPKMVRMDERIKAGKFSINGVNLAPAEKTIAIGKEVVAYRAEKTIEAIKKTLHK